jgi:hypothetical protein
MRASNSGKAKRKKRSELRSYRRHASEAYERAQIARELGSHGGASAVRLIDPATGQQIGTKPMRKQCHQLEREQSRPIGRAPSSNG